jgi:hypothetical protein
VKITNDNQRQVGFFMVGLRPSRFMYQDEREIRG